LKGKDWLGEINAWDAWRLLTASLGQTLKTSQRVLLQLLRHFETPKNCKNILSLESMMLFSGKFFVNRFYFNNFILNKRLPSTSQYNLTE
jgi:hypothetical protein